MIDTKIAHVARDQFGQAANPEALPGHDDLLSVFEAAAASGPDDDRSLSVFVADAFDYLIEHGWTHQATA